MKKAEKIRPYIILILCVGIYILFFKNYVDGSICTTSGSFFIVSLLYWLSFVILSMRQCRDRMVKKYPVLQHSNAVIFFIIPLLAFYVVEVIFNPTFSTIPFIKVLVNYLIFVGLQIGILLLSHSYIFAYASVLSLAWIFGVANYYVMKFKGNPLLPGDLLSYKTAMSVVGNYTFELSDSIVCGCLLFLYGICIIKCFAGAGYSYSLKRKLSMFILGIGWVCVFVYMLINISWAKILHINIDFWAPELTCYANGTPLTFLLQVQIMQVTEPEGYSQSDARSSLEAYKIDGITEKEVRPSVIVIMNEAFSDLSVVGEFESESILTNFNNMSSYMMKGKLYMSVYGGGTCNSEFEFLTGNSMANFTSSDVYPYQMYNLEKIPNLAAAFSENGYETVAMHPELARNWERDRVYQQFGFQDFISFEDMKDVQRIRGYATDAYNYQQIIDAYENKEEPIFIFNVTMQNHGGYKENLTELEPIEIEEKYRKYEDVIQYLTILKESDRAFAELISYFSEVEEPVIVCMFGDHQPRLSDEFLSELTENKNSDLSDVQKRFITPYIVWCNYDTETQNVTKDMSANYLGANILELAGIETAYSKYLLNLQESVPIINSNGYQNIEREWFDINEPDSLVEQYRNIQYYLLFDKK